MTIKSTTIVNSMQSETNEMKSTDYIKDMIRFAKSIERELFILNQLDVQNKNKDFSQKLSSVALSNGTSKRYVAQPGYMEHTKKNKQLIENLKYFCNIYGLNYDIIESEVLQEEEKKKEDVVILKLKDVQDEVLKGMKDILQVSQTQNVSLNSDEMKEMLKNVIDTLSEKMDRGFNDISNKLDRGFNDISNNLDVLSSDVRNIAIMQKDIKKSTLDVLSSDVRKDRQDLERKIDGLYDLINTLHSDVSSKTKNQKNDEIAIIETIKDKLKFVEERLTSFQTTTDTREIYHLQSNEDIKNALNRQSKLLEEITKDLNLVQRDLNKMRDGEFAKNHNAQDKEILAKLDKALNLPKITRVNVGTSTTSLQGRGATSPRGERTPIININPQFNMERQGRSSTSKLPSITQTNVNKNINPQSNTERQGGQSAVHLPSIARNTNLRYHKLPSVEIVDSKKCCPPLIDCCRETKQSFKNLVLSK